MFRVTLVQRDQVGAALSKGTELTFVTEGTHPLEKMILIEKLEVMVKPNIDISIVPVRLVTEHHYKVAGDSTRIKRQ